MSSEKSDVVNYLTYFIIKSVIGVIYYLVTDQTDYVKNYKEHIFESP